MPRFLLIVALLLAGSPLPVMGAEKWALLVGLTEYRHVRPLFGCQNDVQLFKRLLIKRLGVPENHIMTVDSAQGTRQEIETAFRNWLIERPQVGDTAIFYYSGHGTLVGESDGIHQALCPIDVVQARKDLVIEDTSLGEWIKESKATSFTLVLDACHSGTLVKGISLSSVPKGVRLFDIPEGSSATRAVSKSVEGNGKTVLLAACEADQEAADAKFSEEGREFFQGVFTYSLAQILDRASPEALSRMSYPDLIGRARSIVRGELEVRQTPVLSGNFLGKTLGQDAASPQPPDEPVAPPAASLISVDGPRLSVRIEGDNAAADAVRKALAAEAWLRVVKVAELADRVVMVGESSNSIESKVLAEDGHVVNQFKSTGVPGAISLIHDELKRAFNFNWLGKIHNPSAMMHIQLGTDRGENATYRVGEKVTFWAEADRDCYLTLIDVGTNGEITVLFPNAFEKGNLVRAGQRISLPSQEMGFDIRVSGPVGHEMVKAFATTQPVDPAVLLTGSGPFLSSGHPLEFRKTLQGALAKGLGPQSRPADWAESSTFVEIR